MTVNKTCNDDSRRSDSGCSAGFSAAENRPVSGARTSVARGAASQGDSRAASHETCQEACELRGVVFDLDGVLVVTDRYHYQAWKELADELGLPFDCEINHQLRGVSREESLRRIYGTRPLPPPEEFKAQCDRKNERYKELIRQMDESDVLDGATELLMQLNEAGIKSAVASSSKNAREVVERTGLHRYVDFVADGNSVTRAKPDPQLFLVACEGIGCRPCECVGVEDAEAGVEAIKRAGMIAVGVGEQVREADCKVRTVADLSVDLLRRLFAATSA